MASAKYGPMKYYEEICVFGSAKAKYHPIYCGDNNHINLKKTKRRYDLDFVQPSDVLEFNVMLDNCVGSGSTTTAVINTNR